VSGGATGIDPVSIVSGAADALPQGAGFKGAVDLIVLLTVLSLAPALLVLCTCFTRVVVVLGLLRQAVGVQSMPPSQVMVGLSLLLTVLLLGVQVMREGTISARAFTDRRRR
jgi:flagellar biosynthetic protein FliP